MIPLPEAFFHQPELTWHIPFWNEKIPSIQPWSANLMDEVNQLAQFLLVNPQARIHPEIIALAFWSRAANLQQLCKHANQFVSSRQCRVGKVFHIAPANVDTVFFYSALVSFLSGNQNIVRISQRSGEICRQLVALLQQYLRIYPKSLLHKRLAIVEYDAKNTEATRQLSLWGDMRVIWGGDNAIEVISQIEPQTPQLAFPDRFSIALMQLSSAQQISQAVKAFQSDLLPFLQQACSSPKALFWWQTSEELQQKFYQQLSQSLLNASDSFSMADQVEQHTGYQRLLMTQQCEVHNLQALQQITLMELAEISPAMLQQHQGHGLLLTGQLDTLGKLPFADKLQTIGCYGVDVEFIRTQLTQCSKAKFKRLIEVGKALEFNVVWDGVDLCRAFIQLTSKI